MGLENFIGHIESRMGINETLKTKNIESQRTVENELPNLDCTKLKDVKDVSDSQFVDSERPVENELPSLEGNEKQEIKERGLTEEEKSKLGEETGWHDKILDAMGSMKEAEIYINAELKEKEINGKECLIREDINWDWKDEMGHTNKERAQQGLSPITDDGQTVELHHIGQHTDSPLAELTTEQHRGKGNDTILHDKTKETEIDRQDFAYERSNHWKERVQE